MKNMQKSVLTFIVISIVILLNIVGAFIFKRIDLTEGQIYSLSDASKKVVSNIDDNLIIRGYFTEELPPQLMSVKKHVRDFLDEFKAYSNGHFQYEFVDPSQNEEFEKEAMQYGIPPVQVQILENDEFKVKKVHMGLAIIFEDKKEVIPVVQQQSLRNLEYDLVSLIKKMTADKLAKIGVLQGYGSPNLYQDLNTIRGMLSKQYDLVPVNIQENAPISQDLDALLVISPKEMLNEWSLFAMDQYIMKGGKAGFLIDPVQAELQQQTAQKNTLNLNNLLESYGVKVNEDLVGDANCSSLSVNQQQGFFTIQNQIPYPFVPMVNNLSDSSIVTQNLEQISFYFPSSIDTSLTRSDAVNLEVIARSSQEAFRLKEPYDIQIRPTLQNYYFDEADVPLAVLLTGSFDSRFSKSNSFSSHKVENKSLETRIAVVGDGEFVQEDKLANAETVSFFLNLVDWLVADDDLIGIRSKEISVRPLDKVSESSKLWIKLTNIFLIPILFIILGIVRWQWNLKRAKRGFK